MKRIMFALFSTALMFTACSNEENVKEETQPIEGERMVTFSLGVPGREPVTYAQVHEQDEYAVDQLDIYQFDNTGLVKVHSNVTTTPAPAGDNVARRDVARIELPVGTRGNQNFIFVANNDPEKMVSALSGTATGTSLNDFKQKITKEITGANPNLRPSFLMTGEKTVNVADATPQDLSSDIVMLTRIVARIDVGVRLDPTKNEELTISKIELMNAPNKASLFPTTGFQSPTGSTAVNYTAIDASSNPALTTFEDNTPTSNYDKRYKKLFYLYERQLAEFAGKGELTLYVTADYKENASATAATAVKVRYKIPFTKDVKRNHLYTVVLGVKPDGTGDKFPVLTSEIRTKKWEDEEVVSTPALKLFTFTATNTNFTYNSTNRTMTLNNGNANAYTDAFTVTSKYAADDAQLVLEKSNSSSSIANPNNDWISATTTAGKITITVQENNEGATREGVIWFRSSKDTNKEQLYGIKIAQPSL